MATEAQEPEVKKVSKFDALLNKIDAFFEGLSSKKDDPDEDDEMDSKKADDEDAKKADAKPAPAAKKKTTDDEDSQDPDDDSDPDDDKDDDTYAKKDAEIKQLKALVATQNGLLKEAATSLKQKDEAIRDTIKSEFKPEGSQRSTKKAVENELPSFAQPTTDMAKRAATLASKRSK